MRITEIAFFALFAGVPKLRIPGIYGASAGKPVRYRIPATGARPIRFAVENLPTGLTLDSERGIITGSVAEKGEYSLQITASNAEGSDSAALMLLIGEDCVLQTPLMGWCSWNAWLYTVNDEKIREAADLLVKTGLADCGYGYINLDSSWQGAYGGKYDAIMPNERFPDMKGMYDHIHSHGLKGGIYSTPFLNAWGLPESKPGLPGCTRGEPDPNYPPHNGGIGIDHREEANAMQWAEWGVDYLKYDWSPCEPVNAGKMKEGLLKTDRDFGYCCTVHAQPKFADYWAKTCTSWRHCPDSKGDWATVKQLFEAGRFWHDKMKCGHFCDLDMLEIGQMMHSDCTLTEDEIIFSFSTRAFFNSPIQISCRLDALTDFEMAVLTNDEIIAINQNVYHPGAIAVEEIMDGETQLTGIYRKPLSSDSEAVALFNLSDETKKLTYTSARVVNIRDAWAKRDLGKADEVKFEMAPHTVRIVTLK
ncbi:MAG: putative Ig domain-containing protein [Clostridia bacterium]|nr:putative Ig domain-containing protein [Clostridia bacterium]